jgi:hypothetical protein
MKLRTLRKIELLWKFVLTFRYDLYLVVINVPIALVASSLYPQWQSYILYGVSMSIPVAICLLCKG